MKFLDIVVFGKTNNDLVFALQHAIDQLRMGTPSESTTFQGATHVTYDIRDCSVDPWKEKLEAYVGDPKDHEE